jgi:hypothetical protein
MANTNNSEPVSVSRLSTAIALNILQQDEAAKIACSIFTNKNPDYGQPGQMFEASSTHARHLAIPACWYQHGLD